MKDFEFGALEKLFEKMNKDPHLSNMIENLIHISKMMGKTGLSMEETASACTFGWMIGKDPELQKLYNFIMLKSKSNKTEN